MRSSVPAAKPKKPRPKARREYAAHRPTPVEQLPIKCRKVLKFLRKRGSKGASTLAIFYFNRVCAISTVVWRLRWDHGYNIPCVLEHTTKNGTKIHRYTLKRRR